MEHSAYLVVLGVGGVKLASVSCSGFIHLGNDFHELLYNAWVTLLNEIANKESTC